MSDILPEPTDDQLLVKPNKTKPELKNSNRQTAAVIVGLIVVAIAAILAAYINGLVHNHDSDNTRKSDLSYIAKTLNNYNQLYNYYPTLDQLNAPTFNVFSPTLNYSKFKDPNSVSTKLTAQPSSNHYAYEVSPPNCNNTTIKCSGYKLIATLSSGSQYIIQSPINKK